VQATYQLGGQRYELGLRLDLKFIGEPFALHPYSLFSAADFARDHFVRLSKGKAPQWLFRVGSISSRAGGPARLAKQPFRSPGSADHS